MLKLVNRRPTEWFSKRWFVGLLISPDRRLATMKSAANGDNGTTLRHLRYRQKIGNKLPAPSLIELVVVGSGRNGTPQSVFLSTNNIKYLFNCGEGTQRIVTEHKMKLSRIDHIFVTHGSWSNIGGLMGLCLTLETIGIPQVTLHGPPLAELHVTSARNFAHLRSLQLAKREISEGDFVDSAMRVQFVPIYSTGSSTEQPSLNGSTTKKCRLSVCDAERTMSIVHICKPHPKPRALSLEKCVEHNVPAGPLMGQLKEGEEITLADGHVVRPDDVLEPAEPNNPFIVVECPSVEYIESLVSNTTIAKYQELSCDASELPASLVIHLSPASVMNTEAFQTWMSRFGDKTHHIVLNELGSDVAFEAVYSIQAKLNLLHSRVFPLLPHQCEPRVSCKLGADSSTVIFAETNLKYSHRAKVSGVFSRDQCIRLENEEYTKELLKYSEFNVALAHLRKELTILPTDDKEYPEIVFLGTGSAMPNKVRNVSAILVNISETSSILLDCGENTFGQLYRHYGDTEMVNVMRRLRAVFVSHLHADHHLGVVGLALERHKILQQCGTHAFEPLTVIAAGSLSDWYDKLNSEIIPITSLVTLIPIEKLYETKRQENTEVYTDLLEQLKLSQLNVVRVRHKQHPHGIVLSHGDPWKIVYSGDTMPCQDLINAGKGCNLLIHEATMEDYLAEDAEEKCHSTTSQAIDVGMQMDAEFILLTHFSQRYAKVPIFNENFNSRVGIAFDNMRVRLSDLKLLPLFTPALKTMFADDYADMEEKTDRKKRQKLLASLP